MNLSDITSSDYLASNDYDAGTVFPPLEIVKITVEQVAVPGRKEKQKKGVVYLKGAPKGWVANKNELRKIGKIYGSTRDIEKEWIGNFVSLEVVSGIRRPDGTTGNAFRVHGAWKRGEQP